MISWIHFPNCFPKFVDSAAFSDFSSRRWMWHGFWFVLADSFRQLQNVVPYTVDHPILVDLASFTSLDLHVNARGISDTQIMLEWEHDHGDHEHDHRNYQYKIRYRPHNGQGYAPLPLVNPYKKKHVEDGNIIILKKLQAGVEYEIGVVVKCLPADDQRYIACYACTLKHWRQTESSYFLTNL